MMPLTHNQSAFVYWVNERETVRKAKMIKPEPPWSYDPIFQTAYFCNVRREDDRVTKWIRLNWNLETIDMSNMLAAMVAARLFNNESMLDAIGPPLNPKGIAGWLCNIREVADFRKERKIKNFNGAYMVSTQGAKAEKVDHCLKVIGDAHNMRKVIYTHDTLQGIHNELQQVHGLGSFLAAQVIADLKNTPGMAAYSAPDKDTFSAAGPGSVRGLTWFWSRKTPIRQPQYTDWVIPAREKVDDLIPDICMQDFQNCLCEFDKYCRIYYGTGKSKRKYNGLA